MKKTFKKTSAIALIITTLSIALVGCGTGADNASMSASPAATALFQ